MNKKGYKTYRDNKYNNRKMRVTKRQKRGLALATAIGTVMLVIQLVLKM